MPRLKGLELRTSLFTRLMISLVLLTCPSVMTNTCLGFPTASGCCRMSCRGERSSVPPRLESTLATSDLAASRVWSVRGWLVGKSLLYLLPKQ